MIATKPQPKSQQEKVSMGNSSSATSSLSPNNGSSITCVVSKGTHIDGQFDCTESIRLDGSIKGELHCDKRLVIGSTGKVEGKVETKDADISGTIEGDLIVTNNLILRATARVKGTLTAKNLTVEEGAVYDGDCKIG